MNSKDIQTQLSYLRTRFVELLKCCQAEVDTPSVSSKVRNITQDMLLRLNRLLDNIMYQYYEENIFPKLTPEEKKKIERKVQFPVVPKREDFKSMLVNIGLNNKKYKTDKLTLLLESYQPYQTGQEWLKYLRDYSNLCHRKFIPQNKKKETSLTLANFIKISDTAKVTMSNCIVNGVPIEKLVVDKGAISGKIDPRLNPRIETKITYLFNGTNINVLWLCQKSLEEVEKLVKLFEGL